MLIAQRPTLTEETITESRSRFVVERRCFAGRPSGPGSARVWVPVALDCC